MPSDRKPSLILPVAMTAMLLGLYVGAYYGMVRGDNFFVSRRLPRPIGPEYHVGPNDVTNWLTPFFSPIHWLDRRIRPHVWEPGE